MVSSCFKCNIDLTDSEKYVSCDGCRQKFHYGCTDLTPSEIRVIELKTKRSLKYFCEACQEGLRLIPILKKRIDVLEQRLELLEADIKKKSTSVAVDQSLQQTPLNPNPSGENIMTEIFERQKRVNNIMIFNFNLPTEGSDTAQVATLLTELCDHPVEVSRVTKLGKPNRNGHKPLKVILSDTQLVHMVLKNRYKVLTSRQIYIEADLTPLQLSELKSKREELRTRRANGEVDLVLRYTKGQPSIISKN